MFDRIKAGVKRLADNYKQQKEKNAALEQVQQEMPIQVVAVDLVEVDLEIQADQV